MYPIIGIIEIQSHIRDKMVMEKKRKYLRQNNEDIDHPTLRPCYMVEDYNQLIWRAKRMENRVVNRSYRSETAIYRLNAWTK